MLIGTNLQYANSYNNRIILETIRLYGPLSRVGIAKRTQLTAQTVTNITKKLMKAGLVIEDSRESVGPGAPSILLKVNEKAGYSVGIDFDKDHLTVILVDFNGRICQKKTAALRLPEPMESIELMSAFVRDIISEEGIDRDLILGVGLGFPGPLSVSEQEDSTRVMNPEAFPGWENVPIIRELEKRLHMPILLENNASAAAIGEHWYGDGKHIDSFFYIYFGAGLGGGIVINGQLYSGYSTNAGELGYFPTSAFLESGKEYEYDHLGGFFDMPRLQKKMRKKGYDVHSMSELGTLYEREPQVLDEWITSGARSLVPLILGIDYLLDPEAIFLGGRMPDSILRSLLDKLQELLPPSRIERTLEQPRFRIASAGIDAAALGVASLPLYSSFAPQHRLLMQEMRQAR
ncbi:ROK family transcriptional regulator [Balneolales bacterium ANBcel1]|nr:ROK family transcriptional regulator [Balneolales bacterium ANBcel1]